MYDVATCVSVSVSVAVSVAVSAPVSVSVCQNRVLVSFLTAAQKDGLLRPDVNVNLVAGGLNERLDSQVMYVDALQQRFGRPIKQAEYRRDRVRQVIGLTAGLEHTWSIQLPPGAHSTAALPLTLDLHPNCSAAARGRAGAVVQRTAGGHADRRQRSSTCRGTL